MSESLFIISDTAKGIGSVAQYLGSASAKTEISTIAFGAGVKEKEAVEG